MASTSPSLCIFLNCFKHAESGKTKCPQHKHRKLCDFETCQNQIYARGRCVRHGGKRTCCTPNCTRNVRVGDFCTQHGYTTRKIYCIESGCSKVAHNRQRCVRHGGGRQCTVEGCTTHARTGGICFRHASILTHDTFNIDSFLKIIDDVMLEEVVQEDLAVLKDFISDESVYIETSDYAFDLDSFH